MMFEGITANDLAKALEQVQPVELKGMELLRQHKPKPGNIFPTGLDRQAYIDATVEMINYTRVCAELAKRIEAVPSQPAPKTAPQVESYSL